MVSLFLTRGLVVAAMLGAVVAPVNAAEPCRCHAAAKTADHGCCCCKADSESPPACCQANAGCPMRGNLLSQPALKCCCKHRQTPIAPPINGVDLKLKPVFAAVAVDCTTASIQRQDAMLGEIASFLPHAGRSLQSLLCHWTV